MLSSEPNSRLRDAPLLALIVLSSLALRLYPTLTSGLPFSTDAWPLIRNAEVLLESTPISLSDKAFDGYNNYWPASGIFGAIFSLITGLSSMLAMSISIPATTALGILIFYVLARRFFKSCVVAFLASILLATSFPYTLFTAGVVKEAYANPLYISLLLIFLELRGWRALLLFALSSIALSMTHHLTSAVALIVLASIVISGYLWRLLRGMNIDWLPSTLALTLAASTALYFTVYAHEGLKVTVTLNDVITLASYQVVAFAFAFYVAYMRSRKLEEEFRAWTLAKYLVVASVPMLILLFCTFKQVTPDAPILPTRYVLYGVPFIVSAPLALLGFRSTRRLNDELGFNPIFWLAPVLGLGAYAVFGGQPLGLTLAYRTINFIWPPLALLCGYGARILYLRVKSFIVKVLVIVALTSIVAFSCYSIYAATIRGERYMGYFWLYKPQEYEAGDWISDFNPGKTIIGDVKYAYLLKGYFKLPYDELHGLLYLTGESARVPEVLVTYDSMEVNGYVIYGGYSVDLPPTWLERVRVLNLVYSNGKVNVYASC